MAGLLVFFRYTFNYTQIEVLFKVFVKKEALLVQHHDFIPSPAWAGD